MTTINEIMARITQHPLMRDVTLEQVIRYTIDFIDIVGYPQIYRNRLADVHIEDYRGVLPCDMVSVVQIMDKNGEALKQNTCNFDMYQAQIPVYRIQGRCIFTSFQEGDIKVAYRAVYVDDNGFPMIPDVPLFQKALELYIKAQVFTYKFDTGDVSHAVLQHTEQDYCWTVGQLQSKMTTPNIAEMENITNMFNQLVPSTHEYRNGFMNLGDHVDLPNKRI